MKNTKYFDRLKKIDKPLFFLSSILFLIGLVMIFSASNVAAVLRYGYDIYRFFSRQLVFLVAGSVIFFLGIYKDSKFYSLSSWIITIGLIAALLLVMAKGIVVNSARSWIDISFFRFQPSEMIKVSIIVWFAAYFEFKRKKLDNFWTNLFPFAVVGIITALIFIQPDLGTATIFFLIPILLYILIPSPKTIKIKVLGFIGVIIVISALSFMLLYPSKLNTAKERLDFKNPCSEEKFYTTGNQVCNSYIAFNNGGLFGKGLGKSTQKYLYLSDSHTDFIFAIIVEETGFIGGTFILLLFILTIWRVIYIGNQSKLSRGRIICYGIAIYIMLHITINLLGIMGQIPLTGVPLPFMSYGGSFALSLMTALTLVQVVAIDNKLSK